MSNYKNSRGWRNCNPLNIRRGEKWQGLVSEPTDTTFCQFITMSHGSRAGVKCMMSYYRLFCQTGKAWRIDNIVSRWAPPNENKTMKYIGHVCELMGREPGDYALQSPLTVPGRYDLALLICAMTCVETGCPPSAVPVGSVNAGFALAGRGDPHLPTKWW